MDFKTKIVFNTVKGRLRTIDRFADEAQSIQLRQLKHILSRAERTEFGKRYRLTAQTPYKEFVNRLPVQTYEEAKEDIETMVAGEKNLLVPGVCRWYAKSSGTTNDKSKFIPVPFVHLHRCHYQGGKDTLWLYLRNRVDSNFFSTKGLILGGSHSTSPINSESHMGDLSSILVQHMPALGDMLRVPSRQTLLKNEWGEKMKAIVRETIHKDVGSLSGVPSWMLIMIKDVLKETGAKDLSDVWPNLEVFFHGGICFDPYREAYRELISSPRMQYMETYNASEGFFAIQDDPSKREMLLMLDYGVFYEFLPIEYMHDNSKYIDTSKLVPLWDIELGRNYAMVITTLGGLYRYIIGDTVKFESNRPYRLVITGRTKHFINAFGEELIVDNAEKALAQVCNDMNVRVRDYTVAPHFFRDEGKGCHDWLIEFENPPHDLSLFASELDGALQAINSDYEAKRYQDMTLRNLNIIQAPHGLFHHWLETKGKLGGQHKIPRLSNNRIFLEEIMSMVHQYPPNK